ncbi:MAG: DUF1127 domain-containing protein [Oceanicola sp.]|nr:DUF1127 domain-containing protein [Oceanicola sp.]
MALLNTFDHTTLNTPALPRFGIQSLLRMGALARQRRALARLDAATLRDLGLSAADVDREVARPFWDIPAYWRG